MLWSIIEGLEVNGLLDGYTHLYVVGSRAVTGMHSARSIPLVSSLCRLTGYIGSESFLRTVLRLVQRLREINPELVYFCDPVSLCLTHARFASPDRSVCLVGTLRGLICVCAT